MVGLLKHFTQESKKAFLQTNKPGDVITKETNAAEEIALKQEQHGVEEVHAEQIG